MHDFTQIHAFEHGKNRFRVTQMSVDFRKWERNADGKHKTSGLITILD